jgi:putative hemolysin
MMHKATAVLIAAGWSLVSGCTLNIDDNTKPAPGSTANMANPASVRCTERGGTLRMESRPGGQYGVCVFADNRQCEEWAMFRGECPVGGLRVTGYVTPTGRYCAITGGQYTVVAMSNTPGEQGRCALPGGKVCPADAYYAGTCNR